jgi:hypothetical protein
MILTSIHQDTSNHTAGTTTTHTIQDTSTTHTADTTTTPCIQDIILTTQDTSITQLLPKLRQLKLKDQLTTLLQEQLKEQHIILPLEIELIKLTSERKSIFN